MTVIEGMVFAIAVGGYFYLRTRASAWPPPRVGPPALTAATVNLGILLLSAIPALSPRSRRATQGRSKGPNLSRRQSRPWHRVPRPALLRVQGRSTACGTRAPNASIQWTILGLHTTNLLTVARRNPDSSRVRASPADEDHHFLDARLDGVFWYFIVIHLDSALRSGFPRAEDTVKSSAHGKSSSRRESRLWFAIFGPAAAWIATQQLGFVLSPLLCAQAGTGFSIS
jgi:hypothetical protein